MHFFFKIVHIFLFLHQDEYDTHDPKGHCSPILPFLMKRTKVIEIVAAREIVFALAHSGVCAAFSRGTKILELLLLLHTNRYFDYNFIHI